MEPKAPKPPKPPDPYLEAWYRRGRRRTRLVVIFLTWPLVTGIAVTIVRAITNASESDVGLFVAGPIALAAWILVVYDARFKCPRCGKDFHRRGFTSNPPWSRHCLNCDIEFGTPKWP
jgi:hypothetical protein